MNFEDFKKLDANAAFEAASAISGIDTRVLRGLISQESGGNGNAVSRAGARGWAQIMPGTQALLEKKLGIKADVTQLNDSLFLMAHHLADDMQRENGDVANALRAYNNGPNWRDKADPTGENADYVNRVMTKAGVQIDGVQKAADQFASKVKFDKYDFAHTQMPDYSTKQPDVWDNSVDSFVAHAVQRQQQEDNTGILDKAQAFLESGQGVIGAAIHHMVDPEFGPDAVPGYAPPADQLQGYTADELDQLQAARSPREFAYRQWQVQDAREQMDIVGRGNKVSTFLAGMIADAPAQLVLGAGVGGILRIVGMGARAAAAAGQGGRAVALSALEQGTAGAVSAGVEEALGGRVSAQDFTMDVVGGILLGTPLDTPGLLRNARMASIRRDAIIAAKEAADFKKRFDDQAIQNLGADAHPDAIAAEAKRLEFQHLQDLQSQATGHAENAQSRLSTDYEKFLADELEAESQITPPVSDGTEMIRSSKHSTFNDWFGKSQVVDETGAPQIMYHGTASDFAEFDTSKLYAEGIHLTANPAEASKYAISRAMDGGRGASVRPVYVKAEKIKDVPLISTQSIREAAAEGYDAVRSGDHLVVMEPGQVKSAIGGGGSHRSNGSDIASTPAMEAANDAARVRLRSLGDGIHADFTSADNPIHKAVLTNAQKLVQALADKLLPADARVMIRMADSAEIGGKDVGGLLSSWKGSNEYVLRLGKDVQGVSMDGHMNTVVHEVFHMVDTIHMSKVAPEVRAAAMKAFADFYRAFRNGDMEKALGQRFNVQEHAANGGALTSTGLPEKYVTDPTEFIAEQGVKYVHDDLVNQGNKLNLPANIAKTLKGWIEGIVQLIRNYGKVEKLTPEEGMRKFFDAVVAGQGSKTAVSNGFTTKPMRPPVDVSFLQDPIAVKYGLDKLPVDTPGRRAEARAIIELYRRADDPKAVWNNLPANKLNPLTAKFDWAKSTSIAMLRSENPVTRMIASELLESTTGAAGRNTTAALTKYLTEGKLLGNVNNDYLRVYEAYRNRVGGSVAKDFIGGEMKRKFDREVAIEIERRQNPDYQGSADPDIKRAADVMEAAFDRNRVAQISSKTTGWAALPETSRGYMPHSLSAEKVRNATKEQIDALHSALVDQFLSIEGWDFDFSQNLASKYIDRVRQRALGGYESSMNQHSVGAADIVEDALNAMGMGQDEVRAMMQRYMRGAAGHTKKRLNLDLLREYGEGDGKFQLIDLYDTDMLNLMKQQAQRVSGEVALAKYGIMGRPGLKLVRHAMGFGHNGAKVKLEELEAFDQVAAEFLGDPFGNYGGKWMNRAIQFNSLARLGGMGITQAAETINAATILGVGHALSMIPSFFRLRAEAAALAKGNHVGNGLLDSLEAHGGREFGADAYKMVFPFDNPGMNYAVSGQQTNELADRLLRGGLHAQGKLSFWRSIHAAQQRGVAEQIVLKALRYIREGKDDIALNDMGFTKEVRDAIKAEYGNIVKLDGDRVAQFDITKMENKDAADAFVQAVHRGAAQIIQGTFIGETGKWAHSGWLRLMTQFRTFSLVAVEKQWARTRANFGVAKALGMLMGSMSVAAPIYMARVYAQSIGRPDQDEYLSKRLSVEAIARATLNYVALSGLAGDFMDALGSVAGVSTSGGRVGSGMDFIGGVVAPVASTVDDVFKSLQNTKEGTDVYGVVKNLPFANIPYLVPVVNLLKP